MANLSHLPAQWRRSGLSQRAFCERHEISLATFAYWRAKELRAERAAERAADRDRDRDRGREATAPVSVTAPPQAFTEVFVEPQPANDPPYGAAAPATPPQGPLAIEITFPDGTYGRIPVPASC